MQFMFNYEPQKELEADTYIGEIVSINTVLSKITNKENLVVEFAPYKKGKAYKHISLWLEQTYHTKDDLAYKFVKSLDNVNCKNDFSDYIGCKLVIYIGANLKDGVTYFNITDINVTNEQSKENHDIWWNNQAERKSAEKGRNSQINMENIFADDEEDDFSEKLDTSIEDESMDDDTLPDDESDFEDDYNFDTDDIDDDDDSDDEEEYEEYDDEEDSEEEDEY